MAETGKEGAGMKQIVIEIDDDYFELLVHDVERGNDYKPLKIIANGKLLPEHHGRLIDADNLTPDTEWNDYDDGFMSYSQLQIDSAVTILEAKEQTE